MFNWVKSWHKDLSVHEHLKGLRKAKKPSQQLAILKALATLTERDARACSQLCASELIDALKGLENLDALAAGCNVLDTVASKTDVWERDSLGNYGAIKFVATHLKDSTRSALWPTLSTTLVALCASEQNRVAAKSLGVVESLLNTFRRQEVEPGVMDYIVNTLKVLIDLREDPIEDLRATIPQLLYVLCTCVHRPSGKPSALEEQQANLACQLGCFMAGSVDLANSMFERGALQILVDLVNVKDHSPAYLANALRFLISISKARDLGFESLPSLMEETLVTTLREALTVCNKPKNEGKVATRIGKMLQAWLASQAICEICDSNDKFLEKLVYGEGLRLLFDLLKSDFSSTMIRYGSVTREEMFELKEGLLMVLEELCKDPRYHPRVNACGGLGSFRAVINSTVQDRLKDHARKAILSLERRSPSRSPASFASDNPLYENRVPNSGLDVGTSVSAVDTLEHVRAPSTSPPLLVSSGQKRKVQASESEVDTTTNTRATGPKRFRKGPIFMA